MPATTVTANTPPAFHDVDGVQLTENAIDTVNDNDVVGTGYLALIVRNAGASPQTFTVTSQPDDVFGRTGDISKAIPAGETHMFRIRAEGWADGNGKVNFSGTSADLKVMVLNLVN